jgi:hypothetical protein
MCQLIRQQKRFYLRSHFGAKRGLAGLGEDFYSRQHSGFIHPQENSESERLASPIRAMRSTSHLSSSTRPISAWEATAGFVSAPYRHLILSHPLSDCVERCGDTPSELSGQMLRAAQRLSTASPYPNIAISRYHLLHHRYRTRRVAQPCGRARIHRSQWPVVQRNSPSQARRAQSLEECGSCEGHAEVLVCKQLSWVCCGFSHKASREERSQRQRPSTQCRTRTHQRMKGLCCARPPQL